MIGRRVALGASAVLGLVLVVLAFVFWVPDAGYATKPFSFTYEDQKIAGQITLPNSPVGDQPNCIVFVHGDGAMDREAFGYFDPYFSQFAEQGWCSLSWDKPGVGQSSGDWLGYDMSDRTALVEAAIAALRADSGLAVDRVGVLGFSQAGWVMPKIDVAASNVEFIVFVSPAINWMKQSTYMTDLRRSFEPDSDAKMAAEAELDRLIETGGSYQEFLALSSQSELVDAEAFSEARWDFVVRNASADLRDDLRQLPEVPVLLLLGDRDGQVDAQESRVVFEELLPADQLEVHMFDKAGHSMVPVDRRKPMSGEDGLWLIGKIMLWGSAAFVDDYWATLNGFIAAQFDAN
ncbi:alpha/beta hydrolase family protein [Maritalea mediterranea]|uniref:Alpha/beta fold hydrolase n=1 Tax=Maritalea mediterranea TaxID=2909667 RepID=A0ABS9EBH3_9HYPH|nr:alpha/beta hydrolase [Maritalea mediterranea]MCF4099532.1 alpha/beta fold hydrolase [Maritalea mediterranea]